MTGTKEISTACRRYSRRNGILAAGRGALCFVVAPFAGLFPARAASAADGLTSLLQDRKAARMIGLRTGLVERSDAGRSALASAIRQSLGPDGGSDGTEPEALRQRVAAAVREDFAHGRTCLVDGWVLSVTEARLCALAAAD